MQTITQRNVGGFLYLAAVGAPTLKVPVTSADGASLVFQAYRDKYDVRGSTMKKNCGAIFASDGKAIVAKVSYNGRVWNASGALLQEATERL